MLESPTRSPRPFPTATRRCRSRPSSDARDIDDVYFDKPYYLRPADRIAEETFALIREGMRKKKVAAIAQAVLFRRVRTLLIRAHDEGLIATTLNFDYEVRSAKEAFDDVPAMKIKGEMLELAKHIIKTKGASSIRAKFDDRYEAALAELVKAKLEGKTIEVRKRPKATKVVDLMEALRQSAGARHGKRGRAPRQAACEASAKAAQRQGEAQQASPAPRRGRRAEPHGARDLPQEARFTATPEPKGGKAAAARATASSSRSTPHGACTTISAWRWTAS